MLLLQVVLLLRLNELRLQILELLLGGLLLGSHLLKLLLRHTLLATDNLLLLLNLGDVLLHLPLLELFLFDLGREHLNLLL